MGYTRWDADDFDRFTVKHTTGRKAKDIFTSSGMPDDMDPARFRIRESRDSAANPQSFALMLMSDVTGSMGADAEVMIRTGLDTIMREIDKRKTAPDLQILVGAIGDCYFDRAPIQMSQFEAGVVLCDQLKRIYIEHGGGGNNGESYLAAHYAAGMKTSLDCFEKRGRKGVLFTFGDEPALDRLTVDQIKRVFNIDSQKDLSARECLAIAQRSYEVFHVVFTDTGVASRDLKGVLRTWEPLLGERVLKLADVTKAPELVVSTLQVLAGETVRDVAASWSGKTAMVVGNALAHLTPAARGGGLRRF